MKTFTTRFALLIVAGFTFLSLTVHAQEAPKEMALVLLDVKDNFSAKSFDKAWKKRVGAWEKEVMDAKSWGELNQLLFEFNDNLLDKSKSMSWKAGQDEWQGDVKKCKRAVCWANLFNEFLAANTEIIGEEWANNLDAWNEQLLEQAKIADAADKKVEMEASRITVSRDEIAPVFDKVWGCAKEGFECIIDGDKMSAGGAEYYSTQVQMPKARGCVVEKVNEDDDYVLKYTVIYDCGEYAENAKALLAELKGHLDQIVPKEYPASKQHRNGFQTNQFYIYEYDSDDFTKQAKNPTVTLGVRQFGQIYTVELRIEEPVFK